MNILFVCTGNTCRSPMAEGLFNNVSEGAFSRGLAVLSGAGASENAVTAMKKRGIDITGHKAEELTRNDVEKSDIVLTMTKRHRDVIVYSFPDMSDKVFSLGEYVGDEDVAGPYGGDESIYEKCAEQLEKYIEKVIEKIGRDNI